MKDIKFGMATNTVDEFAGMLGLGYGEGVNLGYKNFVDQLAEQDITDTKAFSLALGDKQEQEGVIIFGGLDRGKFTGTLHTLPVIPPEDAPDGAGRYWVDLQYIAHTHDSGKTFRYPDSATAVFLDSGATLSLLPHDLADSIASDFQSLGIDDTGLYVVDCALDETPGTLDFAFDGITIHVPHDELVRQFVDTEGNDVCYLGIGRSEDFVLLGDSMLRSTYAVFDQENYAVHIAQYVNCGNNVMEVTSDTDIGTIEGDCDRPGFDIGEVENPGNLPTATATGPLPTLTGGATGENAASSVSYPSFLGLMMASIVSAVSLVL